MRMHLTREQIDYLNSIGVPLDEPPRVAGAATSVGGSAPRPTLRWLWWMLALPVLATVGWVVRLIAFQ